MPARAAAREKHERGTVAMGGNRVAVIGAKGLLGRDCIQLLGERHEAVGLDLPEVDVGRAESVARALGGLDPAAIVNCAAFTDVDGCEAQREAAWRVNVEGPANLAAVARRQGAFLIHVSTDYVFDGRKPAGESYVEEDAPNPLSYYGLTKLEGERAVAASGCAHAILRTAWMYGAGGRCFPKTMLRLAVASPDKPLRVVEDQFGSPTWSYRLARQIERVLDARASGLYHATAEGACSWHGFAARLFAALGLPHRIEPCAAAEFPRPAVRPVNAVLENARLKAAGLNEMRDWAEDVDEFARQFSERLLREARESKR